MSEAPRATPTRLAIALSGIQRGHHQPKDPHREESQADHEQTGNSSAIEGGFKRLFPIERSALRRAHVRDHGDPHSNITRRERANCSEQKPHRGRKVPEGPKKDENHNGNRSNRQNLAIQVRLGALLDCSRDLAHPVVSGWRTQNLSNENHCCPKASEGAEKGTLYAI